MPTASLAQRRSRSLGRPPTGRALRRAGVTSENVAERFGVSRAQQDAHAARSHQRAAAAQAAGFFDSQLVPVDTVWKDPKTGEEKQVHVDKDDGIRQGATAKALGALKPVFKRNGTTTAGNSSQARAPLRAHISSGGKCWLAGPVSYALLREECASWGLAHCKCAQEDSGLHSTTSDGHSTLVAVGRSCCHCCLPACMATRLTRRARARRSATARARCCS